MAQRTQRSPHEPRAPGRLAHWRHPNQVHRKLYRHSVPCAAGGRAPRNAIRVPSGARDAPGAAPTPAMMVLSRLGRRQGGRERGRTAALAAIAVVGGETSEMPAGPPGGYPVAAVWSGWGGAGPGVSEPGANPRWARMARTTAASWTVAMTRSWPPRGDRPGHRERTRGASTPPTSTPSGSGRRGG
jgi:hypothetical protein